jgi:hypothetical protein
MIDIIRKTWPFPGFPTLKTEFLIVFLVVMMSCSAGRKKPKGLIPENTYIQILAESQLIESFEATYGDSVKTDSLRKALLMKFNLTPEQLLLSHDYYRMDIPGQKKRLEAVDDLLRKEMERLQVLIRTVDSTAFKDARQD